MRVLTADEMRQCDRSAIERFGIPGAVLMETAGRAVARRALAVLQASGGKRALVLCGAGNNGGDGFVAARYLAAAGVEVRVVSARGAEALEGDPAVFHEVCTRLGVPIDYVTSDDAKTPEVTLGPGDVIVDALLGTGLDRKVEGRIAGLVSLANGLRRSGAKVVAVDVPSGLSADTGQVLGVAVQADATVTFGYLKRGLVLHPGVALAGECEVADIGLPPDVESALGPPCHLLDEEVVRRLLPRRPPDAHKGTMGHVLVIAGSRDKPGAAALSCLGALRAGAGLVTLASREGGHAVAHATPEIMGETLPGTGPLALADLEPLLAAAEGKDAVAIGPGIPRGEETAELVSRLTMELDVPMVLDADALNALAGRTDLLKGAAVDLVLTPHPGEMARLAGTTTAEVQSDRLGVASDFARRHDAYLVLKGARTVIADPDGALAVNGSGNAGMATGGTGDVLTGIVAALIAQGLPPGTAARVAVFAHGRAGDLAAERVGQAGLVATDIAASLGEVWRAWGV